MTGRPPHRNIPEHRTVLVRFLLAALLVQVIVLMVLFVRAFR
jgi:hypothetical protein